MGGKTACACVCARSPPAARRRQERYADDELLRDEDLAVHLYRCSFSTGILVVTEIFAFAQSDLNERDIFMLDASKEVYLRLPGCGGGRVRCG